MSVREIGDGPTFSLATPMIAITVVCSNTEERTSWFNDIYKFINESGDKYINLVAQKKKTESNDSDIITAVDDYFGITQKAPLPKGFSFKDAIKNLRIPGKEDFINIKSSNDSKTDILNDTYENSTPKDTTPKESTSSKYGDLGKGRSNAAKIGNWVQSTLRAAKKEISKSDSAIDENSQSDKDRTKSLDYTKKT